MDRIVELMVDSGTSSLVRRHAEELRALAEERLAAADGAVRVMEIPVLVEVLALCGEQVRTLCEAGADLCGLDEALCRLLQLCQRPLREEAANEKLRNEEAVRELLVALATLLACPDNAVKIAAANALLQMAHDPNEADPGRPAGDALDQRPDSWTYHQHLFQKSGAMRVIADAVRREVEHLFGNDLDGDGRISQAEYDRAYGILPGDENPQPQVCTVSLMKLVRALARHRDNALSLNRDKVPELLVQVVSQLVDFRKEEIKLMVQILWSVLEHSVQRTEGSQVAGNRMQLLDKFRFGNALYGLGSTETFGMLRSLLERMLVEGFKTSDKELRNEVLIISSLLARRGRNLPFFRETGFLSLLVLYACAAEQELPTGCDERHFATSDPLDLEMKLLVWHLVRALAAHPDNLREVAGSLYLSTLLFYVDPARAESPARAKWSAEQLRTLQHSGLLLVASLVPLLGPELAELGAADTLAAFLGEVDLEALAAAPLDQQRSAHALMLDALGAALSLAREGVFPEAGEALVSTLLRFLDLGHTKIRCTALLLLAQLCQHDAALQTAFRRARGIALVCDRFLVPEPTNFHYADTVLVAALTCAHSAVQGCHKSHERLLARDGVERLLDALELSGKPHLEAAVLAVLADVVRAAPDRVRPYVLHWRSARSGRTATALALDTWLSAFSDNSIDDLERPLRRLKRRPQQAVPGPLGRLQSALAAARTISLPDNERRVLEAAEELDMRDRVFALFDALGSTAQREGLSRDQQIVLALVESYELFATGEHWADVRDRCAEAGLRPVFYDRALIDARVHATANAAARAKESQEAQHRAMLEDGRQEDEALFDEIREKRDQQVQATLVKRQVSLMKSRLEQKHKQKQMIKRASQIQQQR